MNNAGNEPIESQLSTISSKRHFQRIAMNAIRRTHLFLGLLLFPWAMLYGVSAFLFNHPTVFSDETTATFDRDVLVGTPLEMKIQPQLIAMEVVKKLNEDQKPSPLYQLSDPKKCRFTREFAFATIRTENDKWNLLIDLKNGTGTIRKAPIEVIKKEEPLAPFATKSTSIAPALKTNFSAVPESSGIKIPLQEDIKTSIPTILARKGFPNGQVTITSIPDIAFPIVANDREWIAIYNPMTGSVSGKLDEGESPIELGWRRFLLRLHTAHGYPSEYDSRWFWALLVDITAIVLLFWSVSGLLMWWQIKSLRRIGIILIAISFTFASGIGILMFLSLRQ